MSDDGQLRRSQRALIAATGADSVAVGAILPALPFIVLALGAGPFGLGVMIAATAVAGTVGAPLWGMLADRYGTRRLLLTAPLVAASGHVLFALSTTYPMLLAGRVVAGFGTAVVLLAQTHATLTVSDDARTAALGRITAAQSVGTILGPALGGMLLAYGNVVVGLAAASGPLAAWLLTLLFLPPLRSRASDGKPRPRQLRAAAAALRSREMRWLSVAILLGWLCFMGYSAVLPVELVDRLEITPVVYGYLVAVSGAVALTVRGFALGRLVKRFGEVRLMTAGALLIAASMVLAPLIPTLWLAPLLPLTWAFGASLLFPATVAELSRMAPAGATGLAMGASVMLSAIGIAVGPFLAGLVQEFAWRQGPFVGGAVLMVLVAMLVSRGPARRTEPTSDPAPTTAAPTGDTTTPDKPSFGD
ncbi:MAG: MFS transporter [Stackebrandtia sp.]